MKFSENVFKVLANKHRLQILYWLKNPAIYFTHKSGVDMGKFGVCVGEIQKKSGLTQSTTSHYLSTLEDAGLLVSTRVGKWTYYRRNEDTISALSQFIEKEL